MPVINDATVVNSAYDTSGNGGRKLVKLASGNQYSAMKSGTSWFIYKTTNNYATTPTLFKTGATTGFTDIALATNGTHLFQVVTANGGSLFYAYKEDGTLIGDSLQVIDSGQTTLGNVTLAINDAGTELHAAWGSKNSTYPNSFNIRYAKGTIATDGSVTWGAVEQRTMDNNSAIDNAESSIVLHNDKITIVFRKQNQINSITFNGASWGSAVRIVDTGYLQSAPSAIFVPQSINGLANGRIWVAWHGTDSTDTIYPNIRLSYSDDGGITWSTPTKLTSGNAYRRINATITATKNNEIFVIYNGYDAISTNDRIRQRKFNGNAWENETIITTGAISSIYPSALVDFSLTVTQPLFVYSGVSTKVGFYGTWNVTTNSVPSGYVGPKSVPLNLLSYAITTDGSMSTITEKVNGVTVGTKTATSGQALNVSLTEAQWDAVEYGKYATASGTPNTLTIEMGTEKWTYTFTKTANENTTESQLAEALKDMNEVFLPGVKEKLAVPIRSKGGTVPANPGFDGLAEAIAGIPLGKKFKVGNFTISGSAVAVTGLGFTPKVLMIKLNENYYYKGYSEYSNGWLHGMRSNSPEQISSNYFTIDGFNIPSGSGAQFPNGTWTYYASE